VTAVPAAKAPIAVDASEREWAALSAEAPQPAATMRRYIIQPGTFLAPRSVDMASHTLRQFAGWLVANTEVRLVADITRTHIEDYKGVARSAVRGSRARPWPTPSASGCG
jgi:hypothetical protein